MKEKNASGETISANAWRSIGLLVLGLIAGGVMVLVFLAYGQPELLLEQMNLRYCG